jgi:hypothetical protein
MTTEVNVMVDSIHMAENFGECVGCCRYTVPYIGVRQYVSDL